MEQTLSKFLYSGVLLCCVFAATKGLREGEACEVDYYETCECSEEGLVSCCDGAKYGYHESEQPVNTSGNCKCCEAGEACTWGYGRDPRKMQCLNPQDICGYSEDCTHKCPSDDPYKIGCCVGAGHYMGGWGVCECCHDFCTNNYGITDCIKYDWFYF